MLNGSMFSSEKQDWETPQDFFDELNKEFQFTLDPCASANNAKCDKYYTIAEDGLSKSWFGEAVFCNPPYGRYQKDWIKKAHDTCKAGGNTTVVMLLPARTDTKIFHEYILEKSEIRFVKGRLKFGNSTNSAPFPSMVVIYRSSQG